MVKTLTEVTGFRAEKILELRLTEYQQFAGPLFRPGFLGDKWPSIDFYVELQAVRRRRPYFFAQAKGTSTRLLRSLSISTKKKDIERLLQIPGPTYIFGIHEPSRRVFLRSVHARTPVKAITRIPLANELTEKSLLILHDEVAKFWSTNDYKPRTSAFG